MVPRVDEAAMKTTIEEAQLFRDDDPIYLAQKVAARTLILGPCPHPTHRRLRGDLVHQEQLQVLDMLGLGTDVL